MKPHLKLYGKKTTKQNLVQEISSLVNGTSEKRPYPISISDIAKILHCSRTTVYKYIKEGKGLPGIPSYKTNGRLELPVLPKETEYRRFNKSHPVSSDPLVAEWMDDLLTRNGGDTVKSWRVRIRSVESVCNTCRVTPIKLLVSQRNTEKILRQYIQLYRQGKDSRDSRGVKKSADIRNVTYYRVQGIRDFCRYYGITWPRGTGGIMSQKVPNHGKYSDIRLTDKELEQVDTFIKEKWGLDSDIYRWFWIGIESCARFNALYNMSLDYTQHINGNTGKTTFIMTAFESKTKHLRGGKWFKYITRPDTQKSLDLIKSRDATKIYESKLPYSSFRNYISNTLKEIYRHLGKTNPYFYRHTSHVLRHIGAHYWLSKTNYNFGIIAEVGGWNTIDELKKSYGQIPPEKILEIIDN